MRRLLYFVEHEEASTLTGLDPCGIPLLCDPFRAAWRPRIRTGEVHRNVKVSGRLADERRLADVPGPDDDLDQPPRFGEASGKGCDVRTFVHDLHKLSIY